MATKAENNGEKLRICIGGGGGFIGSHLASRLHKEGHYVILAGNNIVFVYIRLLFFVFDFFFLKKNTSNKKNFCYKHQLKRK
jgi:nucleoside-diphosphate-sugar epimerase